jgi:hypothetical protein
MHDDRTTFDWISEWVDQESELAGPVSRNVAIGLFMIYLIWISIAYICGVLVGLNLAGSIVFGSIAAFIGFRCSQWAARRCALEPFQLACSNCVLYYLQNGKSPVEIDLSCRRVRSIGLWFTSYLVVGRPSLFDWFGILVTVSYSVPPRNSNVWFIPTIRANRIASEIRRVVDRAENQPSQ